MFKGVFLLAQKIFFFLMLSMKVCIPVCPVCVTYRKVYMYHLRIHIILGVRTGKTIITYCCVSCWFVLGKC